MPNDEEVITQETDTETTENTEETTEEEVVEEAEDIDALKKRLATAEAQKEHWRNKANSTKGAETNGSLSIADIRAISTVHEDDVERVEKFAKDEGISIREAMKNDELRAILSVREEKRNTATATNVTNVRRGASQISDDTLISNAEKGKLPDDEDSINRLIAAKLKRK